MSLIRVTGKRKDEVRKKAKKLSDEYLKNGGKITVIETGKTTSAATVKYKYRNARKKKVVPEE